MHIIECHFEFSGFDDHLVKAGTPVYLWNLARQFVAAGHHVGAVTAAHGLLPQLRRQYDVIDLDWHLTDELPVALDPEVWPNHPAAVRIPVTVTAHRIVVEGVEIVLLAGSTLDDHPDTFYPPAEAQGRDLSFLKPLVFQAVAARYLADTSTPGTVVHLHEPVLHYILPAALADKGLITVSTVQTNLPVNTKVYGPEVRTLLRHLGSDTAVTAGLADPPMDTPLQRAMRSVLPSTLLYRDYPERPGHDYVSVLGLVVRSVQAMDFLSHGQLAHALTQAETPFEQLFAQLTVRRELFAHADRLVVGGCAIGDEWLHIKRDPAERAETLRGLGLDPALPTVYHNGRYSVEHKGVREMLRALLRLLDEGERFNVLMHLLVPSPPQDEQLAALTERHADLVHVDTSAMAPGELVRWAAAGDLSVFTSKFERDTFLMAMGEAMAAGAVPIATAQRGMRHFLHNFDLGSPDATGLALPRSFTVDDPLLTDAAHRGLRTLLHLVRTHPERLDVLRGRAVTVARQFTWQRVGARFLAIFEACAADSYPLADPETRIMLTEESAISSDELAAELANHVEVRIDGDMGRVTWRGPQVARALAVTPGPDGRADTTELTPGGSAGVLESDVPLSDGHVILLVTLLDGRSVWLEAFPQQVPVPVADSPGKSWS